MSSLINVVLLVVGTGAMILSLPGSLLLFVLTAGGLLPARRKPQANKSPKSLPMAIVVPSHNEESGIASCIRGLLAAGATPGEIHVIADNCTDHTADVARSTGVQVLERHNDELRGKGYALDYAFRALLPGPFQAFVVVDADTIVAADFVSALRNRFLAGADAVQCRYLVLNPGESIRTRIMNVALLAFNSFRPRGRARWNLSSGILGNGFGLARRVLESVPYDATSVVEDLEYHLRLVSAGYLVEFAEETAVYGEMPVKGAGVKTQRSRWEGGRFRMMSDHAVPLAGRVIRGEVSLLEPLMELLLLPLALHVSLLLLSLLAPEPWIRWYGISALTVVLIHVLGAVWAGGGGWRDLASLAVAPLYLVWKVAMLPKVLRNARSGSTWVRTERSAPGGPK